MYIGNQSAKDVPDCLYVRLLGDTHMLVGTCDIHILIFDSLGFHD